MSENEKTVNMMYVAAQWQCQKAPGCALNNATRAMAYIMYRQISNISGTEISKLKCLGSHFAMLQLHLSDK